MLRSSNLAAKLFVRLSGRSSAGFVGIAIASEEERFWELAMISLESVAGFGSDGVKVWLLGAEEGGNWVVAAKQPAANRGKKRPVAAV